MKIFGLIGYPLGHSFSEKYFADKFQSQGITDSVYRNFPLTTIDQVEKLILSEKSLQGFNVTIPYKEQVLDYINELDETALAVQAVNTVKISREGNNIRLKGFNTDVYGFGKSMDEFNDMNITAALVLGTGGASKAVIHLLEQRNIHCTLVSRNAKTNYITYRDLNKEILDKHRLIVNTTPLGTFPETEKAPDIPYQLLSTGHVLHDLVYNPEKTLFMKKGEQFGAKVKNGYEMLVQQAERSWFLWNDNSK